MRFKKIIKLISYSPLMLLFFFLAYYATLYLYKTDWWILPLFGAIMIFLTIVGFHFFLPLFYDILTTQGSILNNPCFTRVKEGLKKEVNQKMWSKIEKYTYIPIFIYIILSTIGFLIFSILVLIPTFVLIAIFSYNITNITLSASYFIYGFFSLIIAIRVISQKKFIYYRKIFQTNDFHRDLFFLIFSISMIGLIISVVNYKAEFISNIFGLIINNEQIIRVASLIYLWLFFEVLVFLYGKIKYKYIKKKS